MTTNSFNQTDSYNGQESTSGGGVQSVVAGPGINVDNANPQNPIVSAIPSPIGGKFGFPSIQLAACRQALAIPGVNNAGALLATFFQAPTNFVIDRLTCFVKQTGGGLVTLGVYDQAGNLLARTVPFIPSSVGLKTAAIAFNGAGAPITSLSLEIGTGYYLAIHGNQSSNGAQFYAYDAGTTFGPTPWIGWTRDNIATMPATISTGSESSIRFYIGAFKS